MTYKRLQIKKDTLVRLPSAQAGAACHASARIGDPISAEQLMFDLPKST